MSLHDKLEAAKEKAVLRDFETKKPERGQSRSGKIKENIIL